MLGESRAAVVETNDSWISIISLGKDRSSSGAAMTVNLEGVRTGHWRAPSALQRVMSRSLARQSLVAYEVVEAAIEEPPRTASGDRRSCARRRVRLRSGKLLDPQNKFISECLMRDESPQGLCLKLARNVGLPVRYRLYNDETGLITVVATIWRRGEMVGVRYCPTPKPVSIKEADRSALAGRYYAIPD
jgi:hypothetical protein